MTALGDDLLSPPADPRAERFDPAALSELPEPARRWLRRAIPEGSPLADTADLTMHGRIKLGSVWRDYTADQLLAPDRGFVWAARTHVRGLPVSGYDRLLDGEGEMRWRMCGLPVLSAKGADITRSAAGRLAGECVLLPTTLVNASWEPGPDANSAVFRREVAGLPGRTAVTVRVAENGTLRGVSFLRWGSPDEGPFAEHRFAVHFLGERVIDGFVIPDDLHAAWVEPTGRQRHFFRAVLDSVTIRGTGTDAADSSRGA